VHLVGFTIGMYYDARTYERQIQKKVSGFVSLHYTKWNDAFRIHSNVSSYRPTYPDLMTSRGAPSAENRYRKNHAKITVIQR